MFVQIHSLPLLQSLNGSENIVSNDAYDDREISLIAVAWCRCATGGGGVVYCPTRRLAHMSETQRMGQRGDGGVDACGVVNMSI